MLQFYELTENIYGFLLFCVEHMCNSVIVCPFIYVVFSIFYFYDEADEKF